MRVDLCLLAGPLPVQSGPGDFERVHADRRPSPVGAYHDIGQVLLGPGPLLCVSLRESGLLSVKLLPHPLKPPGDRSIDYVALFFRWNADESLGPDNDTFEDAVLKAGLDTIELGNFGEYEPTLPAPESGYNYVYRAASTSTTLGKSPGTWTLELPNGWSAGKDPEDLIVVVGHKVS